MNFQSFGLQGKRLCSSERRTNTFWVSGFQCVASLYIRHLHLLMTSDFSVPKIVENSSCIYRLVVL